jgi:hypothetical protein
MPLIYFAAGRPSCRNNCTVPGVTCYTYPGSITAFPASLLSLAKTPGMPLLKGNGRPLEWKKGFKIKDRKLSAQTFPSFESLLTASISIRTCHQILFFATDSDKPVTRKAVTTFVGDKVVGDNLMQDCRLGIALIYFVF